MRLARGPDDADVIRARLRALLEDGSSGWVPGADPDGRAGPGSDEPDPLPEAPGERDGADADGQRRPSVAGRHRAPGPTLRVDPGRPGARALWVAAVVAVLVLLVLTWRDRPTSAPVVTSAAPSAPPADPAGEPAGASRPAAAEPTGTSGTVVVSVVGRVARPGLVTLPEGARVADAVEAAGGLLPGADQSTINLAAPLADGQQVAVGVPGAAPPAGEAGRPAGGGGPVDVNSAGIAELEDLPGVGPVLAQRIVDHREQHGPFGAVDELQDVPGIGPTIFDGLADSVTV